jgi:CspA family cold shock protein
MIKKTEPENVERVQANVKWYNPEKGYGFLTRDDHPADIMIHFSTLDLAGCPYIKEGDQILCDISLGRSGLQVIRVIDVKFGTPEERSLATFFKDRSPACDPKDLKEVPGKVKWYSNTKGYGFILPDQGGTEIFFHSSVLHMTGFRFLEPGIQVLAKVTQSERGPEARSILILHQQPEEGVDTKQS